jgi:hypothetical protein
MVVPLRDDAASGAGKSSAIYALPYGFEQAPRG